MEITGIQQLPQSQVPIEGGPLETNYPPPPLDYQDPPGAGNRSPTDSELLAGREEEGEKGTAELLNKGEATQGDKSQ